MAHSIEITPIDDQRPRLRQATKDVTFSQSKIREGKKIDHIIEIKETNGQDQLGLHATILKVKEGLRKSNPDAYTPKLISIGPYHYKNPKLGSMEKYKLLYRRRFLQRKAGLDVESCISAIEEMKDKVLNCYDNIEDLDSDIISKFSEIIFLDGCFVVEFIRECHKGEDRIINKEYMIKLVCRDLLLLENQLPFFVLTKLHYMAKEVDEIPFAKLVKKTFSTEMDPASYFASYLESESHAENITHLLGVVHMNPFYHKRKMSIGKNHQIRQAKMPNATKLCEARVRFSKVGNTYSDLRDSTALFDIKFENGQMKIPCFQVNDDTETFLRNLVAYEQQSNDVHPKCFSDFAVFMNYLIHSEKDVNLLDQKGIIINHLGEDREVASMFNRIGEGIVITDFYLEDECRKAIQHFKKPWNRMLAELRRKYFATGFVILLLTFAQTVISFISLFKQSF